jgi:outer membrane protein assembly factor BamD (BamD/ComL family)
MGGKRSRTRQYLYYGLACIVAFAGAGCCAQLKLLCTDRQPEKQQAAQPCVRLQDVREQLDRGDFDGAAREYQDALSRPGTERRTGTLLFELGLLYAHNANPKKDYRRAQGYFARLVREYPRSALAEEARIWIYVLDAMEKAKRVDMQIEEMKKVMTK